MNKKIQGAVDGEDISSWTSHQEIHGSDLQVFAAVSYMITSQLLQIFFVQRCLSGAGCLRIVFEIFMLGYRVIEGVLPWQCFFQVDGHHLLVTSYLFIEENLQ